MPDIQKMRFWGTSAGEGIPAPFCRCRVCEYARAHGGKDLRMRSCFRIDEEVMIDAGADFAAESIKLREDTYGLRHILFTHTHDDHFDNRLLWFRKVVKAELKPQGKIHLYFAPGGINILKDIYKGNEPFLNPELVEFHELAFYETHQIGPYKVTPLKGHHATAYEANSANYIIEFPSGKKMYYAVDSGLYLEETFEYLKNIKLDLLIGECTFLSQKPSNGGHMTLYDEKYTLDRLYEQGTINQNTLIYFTHICGVYLTHDELTAYWAELDAPYRAKVAYDGLSIDKEADLF